MSVPLIVDIATLPKILAVPRLALIPKRGRGIAARHRLGTTDRRHAYSDVNVCLQATHAYPGKSFSNAIYRKTRVGKAPDHRCRTEDWLIRRSRSGIVAKYRRGGLNHRCSSGAGAAMIAPRPVHAVIPGRYGAHGAAAW